jgi:hypothetical protein
LKNKKKREQACTFSGKERKEGRKKTITGDHPPLPTTPRKKRP